MNLRGSLLLRRMAEEVAGQRLAVRRDVEGLVGVDAGVGAGRDVADRVAARLARRQAGALQVIEQLGDDRERHEVELQVLPRRDVAVAARPALGHVGEDARLVGVHQALRDLDADHLDAVLPLAVGAAQQAERAPLVGTELALLELLERLDELVDVALRGEGEAGAAEGLGIVDGCHRICRSYSLLAAGSASAASVT